MKWQWSLLALVLLAPPAFAQEPKKEVPGTAIPDPIPGDSRGAILGPPTPTILTTAEVVGSRNSFLIGNRNFPNFIGFVSNPVQSVEPRAVTQITPIFASYWTSAASPLPSGNFQAYGPGLNIALSERLSFGLNQGGYVGAHYKRDREGFANLGGFLQYTLIQDVPNQFLFTAGLRLAVPSGESDVFQGTGPAYLAPYVTFGKEFGKFHVLGTAGYQFPTSTDTFTTRTFYANVHLDRQTFGWLYPLVEINAAWSTSNIDLGGRLDRRPGFFDLSNFESTGNLVSVAVGANAVLIRDRLEFGAVYTTPVYSQRNFNFDGMLVKMVIRY